jgi:hypothetical protein
MTLRRTITARWGAAVLLLLLSGVAPASADAPAVLTGPHDKNAVGPGPGVAFGFYDPTTHRFTRGVSPTSASTPGREQSGTYNILPDFRFDPAFGPDDSIFCEATLEFGNVTDKEFFPNHTARADVNFSAGDPDKLIQIPYAYTPNGGNAKAKLELQCRGYDDAGNQHSLTIYYPVEDVPDGDVTRQVTDNF